MGAHSGRGRQDTCICGWGRLMNDGWLSPVIYHGTPLTPRSALLDVLSGRAACVSFFRPDDAEAVEAVCPLLMFRQRGIQLLDGCAEIWRGVVREGAGLEGLLRLAGASPSWRQVGNHTRCARGSKSDQRRAAERLAIRAQDGRSGLAHGRPAAASGTSLRTIRPGCAGLDRRPQEGAGGLSALSQAHGRGCRPHGQRVAPNSHAARNCGGVRLSVHQRRLHEPRTERVAV